MPLEQLNESVEPLCGTHWHLKLKHHLGSSRKGQLNVCVCVYIYIYIYIYTCTGGFTPTESSDRIVPTDFGVTIHGAGCFRYTVFTWGHAAHTTCICCIYMYIHVVADWHDMCGYTVI